MLQSVAISRRQSEIRQALAGLVGKENPTEDETRSMENLDAEYKRNETRYRAALISEDTERRAAKGELESRTDKDYADLVSKFEVRQVCLHLDEGRPLDGATAEVVQEMRSKGSYAGVPVPWLALERRSGETVASGTPSPLNFAPIIDRLFPASVSARMGAQMITIDSGTNEYPITSSSITAGWASSETGAVAGPTTYATANRALAPNQTLGIQTKITRKTLKQSGDSIEQAVRRDMGGTIGAVLDKATFLGAGSGGEPLGIIPGAVTYGITSTSIAATATWAKIRDEVVSFLTANAATSPADVRALIRPELWSWLDGKLFTSTAVSEWDKMTENVPAGNITMTSNALAAPTGSPVACSAVLTTVSAGVAPIFIGTWGGIDLIRDPYSDAASGMLRLTALVTADIVASRAAQTQILTGLQLA